MWTVISVIVAIISAVVAMVAVIQSKKASDQSNQIQVTVQRQDKDFQAFEKKQTIERDQFNKKLSKVSSAQTVKPYFYFQLSNGDIEDHKDFVKLWISLKNVGLATAVNVYLEPENEGGTLSDYIATGNSTHTQYSDPLDENFAIVNGVVKFSFVVVPKAKYPDDFRFKLIYSDISGRKYRQEFQLQYGNNFMPKQFSQRNTVSMPENVNDVDG